MELDSLWLVSVQMAVDGVHCISFLADDHILYIYAAVVVGLEWLLYVVMVTVMVMVMVMVMVVVVVVALFSHHHFFPFKNQSHQKRLSTRRSLILICP